jgi:hypothetical protein
MAVNVVPLSSVLVCRLVEGLDPQGNPILRARRWSKVKPTATDQGVYNVALSMAGLQVHTLATVERQVTSELVGV